MPSMRPLLVPLVLLVGLAACGDPSTGPAASTLTPGASVTLAGRRGSERRFTITVPPGSTQLRVYTRDGSGDTDLALRHGAPPEADLYDCLSTSMTTTDECLLDAPAAGTWHITIVGQAAYEAVRLVANVTTAAAVEPLTSDIAITALAGGAGSLRMYAITVPAGAAHLDVELANGTGDADLFIRHGALPSYTLYDCASFSATSAERCGAWNPTPGTWYVRVDGYTGYSGLTLRATVTSAPP